ncbi:MAG: TonB-dependent receptor [Steroidobacteraceae bacterium]
MGSIGCAALCLCAGVESIAVAADGDLEEIIVTATKRDESLQSVPIAITALTSEALQNLGAVNFEDFARTVPGLDFANLGAGQNRVTIRGISTFSGVSVIGIYLDDSPIASPINYTQPSLSLYDLERIEVLRGPQGTLYGEGSLGGTIRYITHPAELDQVDANVDSVVSNTEHGGTNYSVGAMLNAPLIDGIMAFRGELQHREDSGYIDNVPLGIHDFNNSRTDEARVKLTLKASDDLTIRGSAMYQNIEQGGPNVESLDAPLGSYENFDTAPASYRDILYQTGITAEYRTPWANFQSSTSYFERITHQDIQSRADELYDDATPFPLYSFIDNSYKVITEELRAASVLAGPFKWVGGFYFKRQNVIQDENDYDTTGTGAYVDTIYQNQTFRQEALFGELTYSMTSALSATLGLRWFDEHQTAVTEAGELFTVDADKVIPKFLLQYQFTNDRMIYASATEGFRSGGVNLYNVPGVNNTYKPDSTWNYEVGSKLGFLDHHLIVDASLYYIAWHDLQTFVYRPDVGPFAYFVENVSAALSKGIELEVTYAPPVLPGVTLGASGNVTDARYTEDAPFEGPAGNRLPQVPANKWSAFTQYSAPLTGSVDGFARADVEHTGLFYNDGSNTLSSGGYTLLNLRAGVDIGKHWRVDLFVNNATDTVANLYKYYDSYYGVFRNRPRTIGAELRWSR